MNPTYRALQKERAQKLSEAQKFLAGENPSAEDLAAAKALHAEIAGIDEKLAVFEAQFAAERNATPVTSQAPATVRERAEDDPRRGFANVGEFALAVREACRPGGIIDQRLLIGAAPTNYHKEGGSDEGRMVPPAFKDQIWEAVVESDGSLLSAVDTEQTSSNAVEILTDESTPWGATGVQAAWRAEGVQMSASKLATGGVQVKLHELYAFVLATGELLQDTARLTDRLNRKVPLAINYKLNDAIVNGTGAGQPLGWFTSSAKVTVSKESGQAADTVVAANIAKMYARLRNPSQGIWYANQDVLPQLFTMTLGQNSIYVPPATGFANAPGGFLLGRPVQTLENCQTVGDLGDIQFVNPKGYYAANKAQGAEFAESMHLFFDYNISAFRWIFRVGGQPYLSAAVSPAKGSSTRSDVVVLEAR